MFPGRKDTQRNSSESEFGQDNGLIRNTGGRCKIERDPRFLQGARDFFKVRTILDVCDR